MFLQQRSRQQRVLLWPDRCGFTATPRDRHMGCGAHWFAAARRAAMVQQSSGPASRLCGVAGVPLWWRECASVSMCRDVPLAEIIASCLVCDGLLLVRRRTALHSLLFFTGISVSFTYEKGAVCENTRSAISFTYVDRVYIHGDRQYLKALPSPRAKSHARAPLHTPVRGSIKSTCSRSS